MDKQTKRQYQCSTCHKYFNRPSALRTHIYTHTGEKPFECNTPGCSRRFAVVSNLRRHYKVHRKVAEHHPRLPAGERIRFVQRLMDGCNKVPPCDTAASLPQSPLDNGTQPWWLPFPSSPVSSTSSSSPPYSLSSLPEHQIIAPFQSNPLGFVNTAHLTEEPITTCSATTFRRHSHEHPIWWLMQTCQEIGLGQRRDDHIVATQDYFSSET